MGDHDTSSADPATRPGHTRPAGAPTQRQVAAIAPTPHRLEVTSDPPGARVMVDGIGRGATPITLDNLATGATRIRVIKNGYVSQERDVRIGAGRVALHVTLDAVH